MGSTESSPATGDASAATALRRSPFVMDPREAAVSAVVGVAAWYGFRYHLQHALPFGCDGGAYAECGWTYAESWLRLGLPLFQAYAWRVTLVLSASAVALVRTIRNDVRWFSRLGHLALAWPFLSFQLWVVWDLLAGFALLGGLGLVLLAVVCALIRRRNPADLVSLPAFIVWSWLALSLFGASFDAYGD